MRFRQSRVAMICALILMFALVAGCGCGSSDKAGVGYYALQTVVLDGEEYDAAFADMEDAYIIFKQDGSAKVVIEDVIDATWKDGVLAYTENGEKVENPYVLSGDTLTIDIKDENGEITFKFKRVGDVDYVPGATSSVDEDVDEDKDEGEKGPAPSKGNDGVLPIGKAELKEIASELSEAYDTNVLQTMTYEDIRDIIFGGVEGKYSDLGGGVITYGWYPNDAEWSNVKVMFDDVDGELVPSGVSSEFP